MTKRAPLFSVVLSVFVAVVMVSCGGSSPVPNVVGQRLDLAESNVKDAGLDYQVIGGGVFGVVVDANWTVCEQDPAEGTSGVKSVKLIVDRSCAGSTGSVASVPPPTTGLPDVVGMDLQSAQDALQAAGYYDLTSHDATGQGRMQLVDSNWVVVDETPAAGTSVAQDQLIDLGAKKAGE